MIKTVMNIRPYDCLLLYFCNFCELSAFLRAWSAINWVDLGESPLPLRIHHDQGHYLSDLSTVYQFSID